MQAQLKSSVDAWRSGSVLQMLRSHNISEWCRELVVVVRLLGTTPGDVSAMKTTGLLTIQHSLPLFSFGGSCFAYCFPMSTSV